MKTKKFDHIHLQDIPNRCFPRNSKAKEYLKDLLRICRTLNYTNRAVQYGSQVSAFNVRSITNKKGFQPAYSDVFRSLEDFVYHYENYCYRVFALREKLLQFVNAILPVGYEEKDVKIQHMVINPIIRESKILSVIQNFNRKTSPLCKIIEDRNKLTHKLYYGKEFDEFLRPKMVMDDKNQQQWFDEWKKVIIAHATITNSAEFLISKSANDLAMKIVKYKYPKYLNLSSKKR